MEAVFPGLPNAAGWRCACSTATARSQAVHDGTLGELRTEEEEEGEAAQLERRTSPIPEAAAALLSSARALLAPRSAATSSKLMEGVYAEAARLADRAVRREGEAQRFDWDRAVRSGGPEPPRWVPDRLGLLTLIALDPIRRGQRALRDALDLLDRQAAPAAPRPGRRRSSMPWWLDGLLIDGMYPTTGLVIAVMLPPMAIFFPVHPCSRTSGYLRASPSASAACSTGWARTASRP
ncbi:MAG: hypothetical protein R2991_10890 [Thermoanaerobaculia bacterium]